MTVGEKIKKIRQLRGLTQVQLANFVSLPVGRIKQYETNVRNPKPAQLEEFASALGVSTEFLTNHTIDSYNDVKHTLMELEDTFGLTVTEIDGKCVLQFKDVELSHFLEEWYKEKKTSNASAQTLKEYDLWKATYPIPLVEETAKRLREKRKELHKE